jgi:hypothetical protein
MAFNVRVCIPKNLPDKYIHAGIATLEEDVMPLLVTYGGRVGWLAKMKREGFPVEYSSLVDDDTQLELCVRAYWWAFEKILRRKGVIK